MNKFINHAAIISGKKRKCPFIIANTDSFGKSGTHWWSVLDIEPKTDIFFYDSFGLDGLRHFIIQHDKKNIENILFETEKMTRTDNNFFHFIQAFGNKLKLRDFVNIWMVKDRVQGLNSVTCGISQLYFYDNLFNPDESSKIQNKARLNKRTIETLLNELFVLDDQETNEETIKQYAIKNNITVT